MATIRELLEQARADAADLIARLTSSSTTSKFRDVYLTKAEDFYSELMMRFQSKHNPNIAAKLAPRLTGIPKGKKAIFKTAGVIAGLAITGAISNVPGLSKLQRLLTSGGVSLLTRLSAYKGEGYEAFGQGFLWGGVLSAGITAWGYRDDIVMAGLKYGMPGVYYGIKVVQAIGREFSYAIPAGSFEFDLYDLEPSTVLGGSP